MVEQPFLEISVGGTPPRARFTRTTGVPDNLWFSISVNLAPGARPRADSLDVSIDRFLAGRRWLADACREYGVSVSMNDAARDFLTRAHSERRAVQTRLTAGDTALHHVEAAEVRGWGFRRDLRPFQVRDLAKLMALEHGANFSVPGAGKTSVTYALYQAEKQRRRVERLIVVAPLSAFEAWEEEAVACFSDPPRISRFESPESNSEVLLINYQRLALARDQVAERLLRTPTHLVLDEAHRMKRGRMGEWGNVCLDLAQLAVRRDILTGTPAPHSPRDFVALIDFVWPGQARSILPEAALRRDPPDDAMEQVNSALHPLFVRTTKSELGLDPPSLRVEVVRQGELQSAIYDALRNRYAAMFDMSRRDGAILSQMGEVTMYLLEAATNPSLLVRGHSGEPQVPLRYPPLAIPAGSRLMDLVSRYSLHEVPPKFIRVARLVEDNVRSRRKTLIWSNFVGNLLNLEQILAPHHPALIYGGIPIGDGSESAGVRTRELEIRRFRHDANCMVMLANPAATGEGISLHDVCHDAVYLDRTFNAGQYLQSLDRIHRLGLPPGTATNVTFLMTEGTIDETVDSRVRLKAERLSQMLNDRDLVRMALPDEEDYGEALDDVGDLDALFGHLAESNG